MTSGSRVKCSAVAPHWLDPKPRWVFISYGTLLLQKLPYCSSLFVDAVLDMTVDVRCFSSVNMLPCSTEKREGCWEPMTIVQVPAHKCTSSIPLKSMLQILCSYENCKILLQYFFTTFPIEQ